MEEKYFYLKAIEESYETKINYIITTANSINEARIKEEEIIEKELIEKEKQEQFEREEAERLAREKAEKERLEQEKKKANWTTYIDEKGNERRILWAKGINPPSMNENSDGLKKMPYGKDYIDYRAKFVEGNGWYDTNKSVGQNTYLDRSLCFGGVASNMMYWWLDQNKNEVDEFLRYLEEKGEFEGKDLEPLKDIRELSKADYRQQRSKIYSFFLNHFSNKTQGFQTDLLVDFFINGYPPKDNGGTNSTFNDFKLDKRAGFFNEVFSDNIITKGLTLWVV